MWFLTHDGELINLAHMRFVRIQKAAKRGLCYVYAADGSERGEWRLTNDISREQAEAIMLRVAAQMNAIGYIDPHDEHEDYDGDPGGAGAAPHDRADEEAALNLFGSERNSPKNGAG